MKLFNPSSLRKRRQSAMTTLEMLITSSVGVLALAAVSSLTMFTVRSFVASGNYADLDRASFIALDTFSRDVRECRELTTFTSNKLTLKAFDNTPLIYEYKPATGEVTRQKGNETKVLLEQCDFLNFAIYQRNPTNGWSWYPVKSNKFATTKLIDVSWKCSRQILGAKVNTESVQTAKVVLRN